MTGRSLASRWWTPCLLLAGASLGGCGGGADVFFFRILESSAAVSVNTAPGSFQLHAVIDHLGGGTTDVSSEASWSSAAPAIANVNGSGLVTPVSLGRTTVSAKLFGQTRTVPVTVFVVPLATAGAVPVSDVGANPTNRESNDTRNLAIDPLGRIHAVWTVPVNPNGGVRYARSLDGGLSFSTSVVLVTLAIAPNPLPVIAIGGGARDDVYVAFVDSTDSILVLHSADGGATWPTLGVDTGIDSFDAAALSAEELRVHVAAKSSGDYVRSTDGGATFFPPLLARLTGPVFDDVLPDPRNANLVLIGDNPTLMRNVSSDDGATFGGEVFGGAPTVLNFSDFAMDSEGRVFGVGIQLEWTYFDVDTSTYTLAASSFTNFPSGQGRSIAVDAADVVHIAFGSGTDVVLQQSSDQGATLTAEAILAAGTQPDCAASPSFLGVGVLYVSGGQLFYRHN